MLSVGPAPQGKAEPRYTVATAASFKPVLQKLLKGFPERQRWVIVSSSSGKIASQIRHGASFELFLSADEQRPRDLQRQLRLPAERLFRYAQGQLALFVSTHPNESKSEDHSWQQAISRCPKVAAANPRHAPYGMAAQQVLAPLAKKPQLIVGQNVAQVAQFLKAGAVPCGLLALSYRSLLTDGRFWPIPQSAYQPIWQAGLVVGSSPATHALRRYLLSPSSQALIAAEGLRAIETRGQLKTIVKKPTVKGEPTAEESR